MARRFYRKLALLAKLETTYGTDSVPTGAANAILATEVQITPLAGQEVSRELLLPWLGNQGVVLVGTYVQLEMSVEFAGSGELGTPPAYNALLRAAGLAETITADTSVEYDPVSSGFESVSIYFNADGVNHMMHGARGNMSVSLTPSQIPRFRFTFSGLLGTIADTTLPLADDSKYITPLPVTKANTTMAIHGLNTIGESLSIDLGNSVEPRFLIGSESIELTNRNSTGSAVIEADYLSARNWFQIALARTRGPLALQHGTVAGNIIQIDAPRVEIGRITQGQTQGISNYTLPLSFIPSSAGDDEIKLTYV